MDHDVRMNGIKDNKARWHDDVIRRYVQDIVDTCQRTDGLALIECRNKIVPACGSGGELNCNPVPSVRLNCVNARF